MKYYPHFTNKESEGSVKWCVLGRTVICGCGVLTQVCATANIALLTTLLCWPPGSWFYISIIIECEVWSKHCLRACWATDWEMYLNIYLASKPSPFVIIVHTVGVPTFAVKSLFGLCDPKSKEFYFQDFHVKHQDSFWKYFMLTL